jgi:hypothetical protein
VGGYYLDTPNGKFWYETVGSKIEKELENYVIYGRSKDIQTV